MVIIYFIRQHFGDLEVRRQVLDLSVSYTPTTKLQLETEIPFSRTEFDDGEREGSFLGLPHFWCKW